MNRSKVIIKALTVSILLASIFLEVPWMVSVSAQDGYDDPEDRYGTDGRIVPIEEDRPYGRKEIVGHQLTDGKGRVMEEERSVEGENGEKTITTEYYTPISSTKEGEKGRLARRTVRRVRRQKVTALDPPRQWWTEEEIFFEEQFFGPDGKTQVKGSKRERDANGRRRFYRWESGGYVDIALGPGKSSAKSGYSVTGEGGSGLDTTVFATPSGKIRVNLPDDMSGGDTLTGTVLGEPAGKDADERSQNDGELSGFVVEIEKQKASASAAAGGFLKLALPMAIAKTFMVLKDKKGSEVARREINVLAKAPPVETQFDLPTAGQQGRPLEIRGPFDGDTGTTQISIGGNDLMVLAESPRGVIARTPIGQGVGPSAIQIGEKGRSITGAFRTLGLQLTAPKLDLLRGEQTTVVIKVTGLDGLKSSIPLTLENRSANVVQMGGGDVQRIDISPGDVQGGVYVTERPLTGIQRGAFTISATVVASRQRAEGNSLIAGGPLVAKATETKGYEICGTGCAPFAREQGTGKIRCNSSSSCRGRGTDCNCHMFSRKAGSNDDLDHVENPDVYVNQAVGLDYVCRCVKKK